MHVRPSLFGAALVILSFVVVAAVTGPLGSPRAVAFEGAQGVASPQSLPSLEGPRARVRHPELRLRERLGQERDGVFFAAGSSVASDSAPIVVGLHGAGSAPSDLCDVFGPAVPSEAVLLCVRGNLSYGDAADWSGSPGARLEHVKAASLRATEALDLPPPPSRTLLGYSRGAYSAYAMMHEPGANYDALILVGAALRFGAADLRGTPLQRVVLAATRGDGSFGWLKETHVRLTAEGFPSRFVDLGDGPHAPLPADAAVRLAPAIRWAVTGQDSAPDAT